MSGNIKKTSYGTNGFIDFSQLWELLNGKGYNKQWLRNHGIHSNTVAKLVKNENVTCEVIANLCMLLDCQPGDILKYVPNEENKKYYESK